MKYFLLFIIFAWVVLVCSLLVKHHTFFPVTIQNPKMQACNPDHDQMIYQMALKKVGDFVTSQKQFQITTNGHIFTYEFVNETVEDSK